MYKTIAVATHFQESSNGVFEFRIGSDATNRILFEFFSEQPEEFVGIIRFPLEQ